MKLTKLQVRLRDTYIHIYLSEDKRHWILIGGKAFQVIFDKNINMRYGPQITSDFTIE